jgi:hypothetical protein
VLTAGFAFLAIDEMYAFHERSEQLIGDDDHLKLLQWFVAGAALLVISRVERVAMRWSHPLILGYIVHGIYILVDLGDGGYFTFPVLALGQLQWIEELLEIGAMSLYLAGFLLLLGRVVGPGREERAQGGAADGTLR